MPSENGLVKFKYGIESEYKQLSSSDQNTLYYITDTGTIILNDSKFPSGKQIIKYIGHFIDETAMNAYTIDYTSVALVTYACTVGSAYTLYVLDLDDQSATYQQWIQFSQITSDTLAITALSEFLVDSTTGINSNSTDDEIPTAKAVYDYIEDKTTEVGEGGIVTLDSNGKVPASQIPNLEYDNTLSDESENAVQNKVVSAAINGGSAYIKDIYYGNSTRAEYPLSNQYTSGLAVIVDDQEQTVTTDYTYSSANNSITFTSGHIPAASKKIQISYLGVYQGKVDKDGSKVLSTRDFTDKCFTKLQNVVGSATPVQANWTENDPDVSSYIRNKPVISTIIPTGNAATDTDLISSKAIATALEGGSLSVVDSFTGDGSTTTYSLISIPDGGTFTAVTINGTATSAYTYDSSTNSVIFASAPQANDEIEVSYNTSYPGKVDKDGAKVLSDNNFSNADKARLDNIITDEERLKLQDLSLQVNSDWDSGITEGTYTGGSDTLPYTVQLSDSPISTFYDQYVTILSATTDIQLDYPHSGSYQTVDVSGIKVLVNQVDVPNGDWSWASPATTPPTIVFNSALEVDDEVHLQYRYFDPTTVEVFVNDTKLNYGPVADNGDYTYDSSTNAVEITSGILDYTTYTDNATGDGTTATFYLTREYHANLSVIVNGNLQTITTDYTYDSSTNSVTFTSIPALNDVIDFIYDTPFTSQIVIRYPTSTSITNRPIVLEHVIPSLHKYSTVEQVVGIWIDGKPLYERTFDVHLPSEVDPTSSQYIEETDTHNIEHIVSATGYVSVTTGSRATKYFIGFSNGGGSKILGIGLLAEIDDSVTPNEEFISVKGSASFSGQPAVITLQYTKTTD